MGDDSAGIFTIEPDKTAELGFGCLSVLLNSVTPAAIPSAQKARRSVQILGLGVSIHRTVAKKGFVEGGRKSVEPQDIREPEVRQKVLVHMQAAERSLRRLDAALDRYTHGPWPPEIPYGLWQFLVSVLRQWGEPSSSVL